MRRISILGLVLLTQSACVMVGGYSSRGGWFVWPGGLGLLIVILLVLAVVRRGR